MLRRLCAFLLMLACAFAPVLPAQARQETKAACCCESKCACDHGQACVPPPASPARAPEVVTGVVEQRVAAAKPAARVAFAVFARLLADFETSSASPVHPASVNPPASAAGVPLYAAHCSRLI